MQILMGQSSRFCLFPSFQETLTLGVHGTPFEQQGPMVCPYLVSTSVLLSFDLNAEVLYVGCMLIPTREY